MYAGGATPESVQPYDFWELSLPYQSSQPLAIGGAAYDPASGRIFVSQGYADGDHPVIHVFTVG